MDCPHIVSLCTEESKRRQIQCVKGAGYSRHPKINFLDVTGICLCHTAGASAGVMQL